MTPRRRTGADRTRMGALASGEAGKPGAGAARRQAARYQRTRRAHSMETAEDYVEMIAELIGEVGEARVVDIAARLGVSHVTVVRTIGRLQRDGLVSTQPYRAIFLTDQGKKIAATSKRRHEIVIEFLRALGVSEEAAQVDAEGIEHHVGPETLEAFERFAVGKKRKR